MKWRYLQKRDLNYITGILLIVVFLWMFVTGLIQLRFELHRFVYHIYGAYLLIILACVHVFTNWRKLSGLVKNKIRLRKAGERVLKKSDFPYIISIALIISLAFTLISGFLQVKLNFPQSRFVYHIYGAYLTLTLSLIHIYLNLSKVNAYLKSKYPAILLSPERRAWKPFFKVAAILGIGIFLITSVTIGLRWFLPYTRQNENRSIFEKPAEIEFSSEESSHPELDIAIKYHEKTKHTYAEVMARTGGLDWAKQPSVFKEYPQAELIRFPDDFDFNSINVEEAIEMGPFMGDFSGESITKIELSWLLYYTNGITGELRYPGLTYYLRAAPSAGALYPTVIYLVVNNVEGLKKGIYHYSVKDHGLYFLKGGDFTKDLAAFVSNTSSIKNSSVVFIMSAIFYRTKWKYRERGYRYVLLDTGHVGGNLTLIARALDLGSYSMGTFLDDKINQLLEIDGLKEAAVYINAVGKIAASEQKEGLKTQITIFKKGHFEKPPKDLTIAELLHEKGKLYGFEATDIREYEDREVSHKSYPDAQKIVLSKEFSKQGLSLDDTIRKRRSARDYPGKPVSQLELSRLLYYAYGIIGDDHTKRQVLSIEGLYPIEIYIVINNVEGIARGIYHYNVLEHALELLKEGDYRFKIASACLGQELVGNASVAIIKTAVFERVKRYGDRGYRYIHLDAGAIGENIYLESVSMGLGVCGIGAFFDDQINEMLDLDGLRETVIYVTSIGRV